MRRTLVSVFLALGLSYCAVGATVDVQVDNLGSGSYRYSYQLSGFAFQLNQELDFDFDPTLYSMLTNDVVGTGFDGIVFQPNNPPGAPGEFGISANMNNPSLAGPFSIDFKFLGSGVPSGQQPFSLNQFNADGSFVGTIETGTTTPVTGTTAVPEPATASLVVLGVLVVLLGSILIRVRNPILFVS
jgi:hypothetical protein